MGLLVAMVMANTLTARLPLDPPMVKRAARGLLMVKRGLAVRLMVKWALAVRLMVNQLLLARLGALMPGRSRGAFRVGLMLGAGRRGPLHKAPVKPLGGRMKNVSA